LKDNSGLTMLETPMVTFSLIHIVNTFNTLVIHTLNACFKLFDLSWVFYQCDYS